MRSLNGIGSILAAVALAAAAVGMMFLCFRPFDHLSNAAGAIHQPGDPAPKAPTNSHLTTVPFQYWPEFEPHIFVTVLMNGAPRCMIFDTGTTGVCIARNTDPIPGYHDVKGKLTSVEIQLGAYSKRCPVYASPFGDPIDILGIAFFVGTDKVHLNRITLDFQKSLLTINTDQNRPIYRGAPLTVAWPLTTVGRGSHQVPVKINGAGPFMLYLDTGSPILSLARKLLPAIHRESFPNDSTVKVGTQEIPVRAYLHDQAAQADQSVLGLDLLSRFLVTIDYRDKMVYLEPPRN